MSIFFVGLSFCVAPFAPLIIEFIKMIFMLSMDKLGYPLRNISSNEGINFIFKNVSLTSGKCEDNIYSGYILGKSFSFFGYVFSSEKEGKTITICCTKKFLQDLEEFCKKSQPNMDGIKNKINIATVYGCFWNPQWRIAKYEFKKYIISSIQQDKIIYEINNLYKIYDNTVVFITGKSGCGKSTIGYMLANQYPDSVLIDSFHLTKSGYRFYDIYSKFKPTKKSPIILVLNEFPETVIIPVSKGDVKQHKYDREIVTTKEELNAFLEQFSSSYAIVKYPYVIVLITSNMTKESVSELCNDNSYLGPSRINLSFVLTNDIVKSDMSSLVPYEKKDILNACPEICLIIERYVF